MPGTAKYSQLQINYIKHWKDVDGAGWDWILQECIRRFKRPNSLSWTKAGVLYCYNNFEMTNGFVPQPFDASRGSLPFDATQLRPQHNRPNAQRESSIPAQQQLHHQQYGYQPATVQASVPSQTQQYIQYEHYGNQPANVQTSAPGQTQQHMPYHQHGQQPANVQPSAPGQTQQYMPYQHHGTQPANPQVSSPAQSQQQVYNQQHVQEIPNMRVPTSVTQAHQQLQNQQYGYRPANTEASTPNPARQQTYNQQRVQETSNMLGPASNTTTARQQTQHQRYTQQPANIQPISPAQSHHFARHQQHLQVTPHRQGPTTTETQTPKQEPYQQYTQRPVNMQATSTAQSQQYVNSTQHVQGIPNIPDPATAGTQVQQQQHNYRQGPQHLQGPQRMQVPSTSMAQTQQQRQTSQQASQHLEGPQSTESPIAQAPYAYTNPRPVGQETSINNPVPAGFPPPAVSTQQLLAQQQQQNQQTQQRGRGMSMNYTQPSSQQTRQRGMNMGMNYTQASQQSPVQNAPIPPGHHWGSSGRTLEAYNARQAGWRPSSMQDRPPMNTQNHSVHSPALQSQGYGNRYAASQSSAQQQHNVPTQYGQSSSRIAGPPRLTPGSNQIDPSFFDLPTEPEHQNVPNQYGQSPAAQDPRLGSFSPGSVYQPSPSPRPRPSAASKRTFSDYSTVSPAPEPGPAKLLAKKPSMPKPTKRGRSNQKFTGFASRNRENRAGSTGPALMTANVPHQVGTMTARPGIPPRVPRSHTVTGLTAGGMYQNNVPDLTAAQLSDPSRGTNRAMNAQPGVSLPTWKPRENVPSPWGQPPPVEYLPHNRDSGRQIQDDPPENVPDDLALLDQIIADHYRPQNPNVASVQGQSAPSQVAHHQPNMSQYPQHAPPQNVSTQQGYSSGPHQVHQSQPDVSQYRQHPSQEQNVLNQQGHSAPSQQVPQNQPNPDPNQFQSAFDYLENFPTQQGQSPTYPVLELDEDFLPALDSLDDFDFGADPSIDLAIGGQENFPGNEGHSAQLPAERQNPAAQTQNPAAPPDPENFGVFNPQVYRVAVPDAFEMLSSLYLPAMGSKTSYCHMTRDNYHQNLREKDRVQGPPQRKLTPADMISLSSKTRLSMSPSERWFERLYFTSPTLWRGKGKNPAPIQQQPVTPPEKPARRRLPSSRPSPHQYATSPSRIAEFCTKKNARVVPGEKVKILYLREIDDYIMVKMGIAERRRRRAKESGGKIAKPPRMKGRLTAHVWVANFVDADDNGDIPVDSMHWTSALSPLVGPMDIEEYLELAAQQAVDLTSIIAASAAESRIWDCYTLAYRGDSSGGEEDEFAEDRASTVISWGPDGIPFDTPPIKNASPFKRYF